MTLSRRREAARMLHALEPPEWFLRHSCAVADVAAWLATRLAAAGHSIDVDLVAAAALLHDVDKLPAAGSPGHLRHGMGGAAWLEAQGWGDAAALVARHPVTRLGDGDADAWLDSASKAALVVAYADKRAGQRLVPMARRFATWRRRYPPADAGAAQGARRSRQAAWDEATRAAVEARAARLEQVVCGAAGVRPPDVRRLRWSRRALREARA
jgi:predicted hydrolase (HD superfamily)